jgi:hypothetical protein
MTAGIERRSFAAILAGVDSDALKAAFEATKDAPEADGEPGADLDQ